MIKISPYGFIAIYCCSKSIKHKGFLYNAWNIIPFERLRSLVKAKGYTKALKKEKFILAYNIASLGFDLFDEKYIYKDFLGYLPSFKAGDFETFLHNVKLK